MNSFRADPSIVTFIGMASLQTFVVVAFVFVSTAKNAIPMTRPSNELGHVSGQNLSHLCQRTNTYTSTAATKFSLALLAKQNRAHTHHHID